MNYLAIIYYTKVHGIIKFNGKENPNFKKVVTIAKISKPQKYKGKKLRKSYVYPEEKLHPDKIFAEIDLVQMKFLEYTKIDNFVKRKNGQEKAKNLMKSIENAIKEEEKRQKDNTTIII
jgi:predicted metal-binding transcription factor (methanogenesis marker protein 9)